MIRPPGFRGAAFTDGTAGDVRAGDRTAVAEALGISSAWATVSQVHGSSVRLASAAGSLGEADAVVTDVTGLPLAVFTADCMGIILEADGVVAVLHAGWRGVVAGVIEATVSAVSGLGRPVMRAAVGPSIGPCCFEVGPEVADQFDGPSTTTWGTTSVDLLGEAVRRLGNLDLWVDGRCTHCGPGFFSHRRSGDERRMAAIGWLP